jgi:hypothetical protein
MRRNHVSHYEHFPWMSFNDFCQSNSRSVFLFPNLLGEGRGQSLIGEYHIKINVTGSAQVVTMSLHASKHVSIVIIWMEHWASLRSTRKLSCTLTAVTSDFVTFAVSRSSDPQSGSNPVLGNVRIGHHPTIARKA